MTLANVALAPAYDPGSWRTFYTLTQDCRGHADRVVLRCLLTRVRELQLSLALRTRARYLLIWLVAIAAAWTLVVAAGQHNHDTHGKKHTRLPDVTSDPEHQPKPPTAGQLALGEDGSRGEPGP